MSNREYFTSDGVGSYLSSPTESFDDHQWGPLSQGLSADDFLPAATSEYRLGCIPLPQPKEGNVGTSMMNYGIDSNSSPSDVGDSGQNRIAHVPFHCNFSSHYSFKSKPIYPIANIQQSHNGNMHSNKNTSKRQKSAEEGSDGSDDYLESKYSTRVPKFQAIQNSSEHASYSNRHHFKVNPVTDPHCSCHHEHPEEVDKTAADRPCLAFSYEERKCALCQRYLFRKSPWSSHRMVRTGDMPVSAVLCCGHVYHAECLEQATSQADKHDPPCPLCHGCVRSVSYSPTTYMMSSDSKMTPVPLDEYPMFKMFSDDGQPSSSQNRINHQTENVEDVSDRKNGVQMCHHSNRSLLSKKCLRKHFSFKTKSAKDTGAGETGFGTADYLLKAYPGDTVDNFPVGYFTGDRYINW
eukprot:TRINITY_DN2832_c0_g2_i1.p1 TRINITY_DN2832_c0_g2~~TRINITY_DN2832_c0_g2_i1.p1  ORF type:complete len:408 (-),score=52.19 TRINITY_DN2832_c0_g2_i1:296-1519(-)